MELFGGYGEAGLLEFENLCARQGFTSVAGVDEAGRGPLAGPVVAAAVILPPGVALPGVTDSKKLSAHKRDLYFDMILETALAVGIGFSSHEEIDRINILQASLSAMRKAVRKLATKADFLLVDGTFKVPMRLPQRTIVKGDSLSLSIAAASIIAKVTRDRLMVDADARYPGYGFAEHKGYGCATHLRAIASLGPCPIHRKTFSGVSEHLPQLSSEPSLLFADEQ